MLFGIDALAGHLQGVFIDVRGKDLYLAVFLCCGELFQQQHAQRIRFFTGGNPAYQTRMGSDSLAPTRGAITLASKAWNASGSRKK